MLSVRCTAVFVGDCGKLHAGAKVEKPFECTVEYFPAVGALSIFKGHSVPPRFVVDVDRETGRNVPVDATPSVRKARREALVAQLHWSDVVNVRRRDTAAGIDEFSRSGPIADAAAAAATAPNAEAASASSATQDDSVKIIFVPSNSEKKKHPVFGAVTLVASASAGVTSPVMTLPGGAGSFSRVPPAAAGQQSPLGQIATSLFSMAFPRGPMHLIAVISPISGKGEGIKVWQKVAQPILDNSPHTAKLIMTTHRGHAEEIAEHTELRPQDVMVAVGGDGMAHEVINGLSKRQRKMQPQPPQADEKQHEGEARRAASSAATTPPVALFPTGSGCALAKTLGVIEPLDAALALIHGRSVPLDLMDLVFSPVTKLVKSKAKGEPRRVEAPADEVTETHRTAFLSVSFAFGAAVDLESEEYRWMGNARFTFYAVKKMAGSVPKYPMVVRYRPVRSADVPANHSLAGPPSPTTATGSEQRSPKSPGAPPAGGDEPLSNIAAVTKAVKRFDLRDDISASFGSASAAGAAAASESLAREDTTRTTVNDEDAADWVTVDQEEFVFIILCNIPWIARDMLAAPFSHVNDRCMDLVFAAPGVTRKDLVQALIGMEEGKHVAHPKMRYVKCRAVEIVPRDGLISVDGERFPLAKVAATVSPITVDVVHVAAKPSGEEFEAAVIDAAHALAAAASKK